MSIGLGLVAQARALPPGLLGGVCFGGAPGEGILGVAAPQLAPREAQVALLTTAAPWREGIRGQVRYRASDELLFGRIEIDEGGAGAEPGAALAELTAGAYGELFALLDALDYPTLARVWNYVPQINLVTAGVERYRQFNAGRQQAFSDSGRPLSGKVPAACALGTAGGPLAIAFLAARGAFTPLENPRQVSAYDYPPEYGERSPTFSRGGLVGLSTGSALFISGTAAIVGHASLHDGDVRAQAREAMANLGAVLDQATRVAGPGAFALECLDYTIYLRHGGDLDAVSEVLSGLIPQGCRRVFVQADICRADLLVEIEASATTGPRAP